MFEGQKAAQEHQALPSIEGDFDPAIGATNHGAQTQQQDFLQRIKHFGLLARVFQVAETLAGTRLADKDLRSSLRSSQNATGMF